MNRKSKRFTPGKWSAVLVPVILLIILLGLVATLIVVFAASFGM